MAANDEKANEPSMANKSKGGTTIFGLSEEEDFNDYQVGFAVHSMHEQLRQHESPEMMKLFAGLKINIYFWSTVAWACRGDGKLGEKEEKYIRQVGKMWNVSDNDMTDVLKGKDCVDDLLKAVATLFSQLNTKDKDKDKNKDKQEKQKDYQSMVKCQLVMYSLVASAQDGLARAELTEVYKMAQKLGISKERVKAMVNIIRCEQTIANTMNAFFYPEA